MSTKDVLRLIQRREISYVMHNGIAHLPAAAIEEYRSRAS